MQRDTRVSAHEKTIDPVAAATAVEGGRLETYYANVFFIEELRPAPPARVAILPINFHSVEHLPGNIRGLSLEERRKRQRHGGRERERKRGKCLSFRTPECRLL